MNFRFEINACSLRSSDDEILRGDRWFLFCYGFLNGVFDNFLVGVSQVFVDIGVKRRVRKLANCFLLVEVGGPNDCRVTFVGCFDEEIISIFEIYEDSPFSFGEV